MNRQERSVRKSSARRPATLMALGVLLVMLGLALPVLAAPVLNGDFSSGETGWTRWSSPWSGPCTWDTTGGTGNLSTSMGNFGWYQRVTVVPSQEYTLVGSWTGNVGAAGWTEIMVLDCTEALSDAEVVTRIDTGMAADIAVKKDSWGMNPPTAWAWEPVELSPMPGGHALTFQTACTEVVIALKLGAAGDVGTVSFDDLELETEPSAVQLRGLQAASVGATVLQGLGVTLCLAGGLLLWRRARGRE